MNSTLGSHVETVTAAYHPCAKRSMSTVQGDYASAYQESRDSLGPREWPIQDRGDVG